MKTCIRCGLCCTLQLCSKGRRKNKNKKGNCLFLIKNEDKTTSCKLVLENKMNGNSIDLGEGCVMQEKYPCQYEFYSKLILNR